MQCEMCGKTENLVNTKLEGTMLQLCPQCSKYGQILREPPKEKLIIKKRPSIVQETASDLYVVDNFGEIIRKKREDLGLKQNEFAMKVQEKESLIQAIENNKITPSILLAGKLEKVLGIKLIEKEKKMNISGFHENNSAGMTLGNFIKKRN